MSFRRVASSLTKQIACKRSFSQITKEPLPDVHDASIHGLPISAVGNFVANLLVKNPAPDASNSPLGRWKTDVDNFDGKSYHYDHTA